MSSNECPYCGARIEPGFQFCTYCGKPLPSERVQQFANSEEPVLTQIIQQPLPATKTPSHAASPQDGAKRQRDKPYRIAAAPITTMPITQVAVPFPQYPSDDQEPIIGETPDAPTSVFDGDADDFEDMDSATRVIDFGPTVFLVRRNTGEQIELDLPAVVGKGSAATARIGGNNAISRRHLTIEEFDGGFVVEDLGSTNRTSVNDKRVMPGEKVAVENGDVIRIADEDFELVIEQ